MTVVVPARNEARHVEACVRSILSQRVEGGLELLVVDGRSDDETAELARRAGASVLDNPEQTTPAALNRGLAAARGEVVIRFDAHGLMTDGYIAACVLALKEERAANVGGWIAVAPEGSWGRALAAALGSRLGVGNSRLWRPPKANARREDVDTISFGCFHTAELRRAGGWADEFHANQDFELNYRLRRARRPRRIRPGDLLGVPAARVTEGDRASVLAVRPLESGDSRTRAVLAPAKAARSADAACDHCGCGSAHPLVAVRASPPRRLRSRSRCRIGPSPRGLAGTDRSHDDAPPLGSRSALRLRAAATPRPLRTSPSPIERASRAALARCLDFEIAK